jgi:hypothetical protein
VQYLLQQRENQLEMLPFHDSRNPDFDLEKEAMQTDLSKLRLRMDMEGKRAKSRLVRMGEKTTKIIKEDSSQDS